MRKPAALVASTAVFAAAAVAAVMARQRLREARRWARAAAVPRDLQERCAAPAERLRLVADAMAAEMRAGLASNDSEGESGSSVLLKMLVTYVDSPPSGYSAQTPTPACSIKTRRAIRPKCRNGSVVVNLPWTYGNVAICALIGWKEF